MKGTILPLLIASLATAGCERQVGPTPAATDTASPGTAPAVASDPAPGLSESAAPARSTGTIPTQLRVLGTEPFWAIHVTDSRLRYLTPEDQEGQTIEATREQTEQNQIVYSGTLFEAPLVLRVWAGRCSDGMSDTVYPFEATLKIGDRDLNGCARPTDSR